MLSVSRIILTVEGFYRTHKNSFAIKMDFFTETILP